MGNSRAFHYASAFAAFSSLAPCQFAKAAAATSTDALASFEAIIANAKARRADQFANDKPVPPLPSPVVIVPLTDGNAAWPSPLDDGHYTYDGSTLRLEYSASTGSDILDTALTRKPVTYWQAISAWSSVLPLSQFTGSNSFGAQFRVSRFERRTVKFRFNMGNRPAGIFREALINAAPSEARALASVAALEFVLASPSDIANPPQCKSQTIAATASRPIELIDHVCEIPVAIQTIRLVRTDTGEEIPTKPLR